MQSCWKGRIGAHVSDHTCNHALKELQQLDTAFTNPAIERKYTPHFVIESSQLALYFQIFTSPAKQTRKRYILHNRCFRRSLMSSLDRAIIKCVLTPHEILPTNSTDSKCSTGKFRLKQNVKLHL